MVNIYICEDDISQLEGISKIVLELIKENNYDMRIVKASQFPNEIIDMIKIYNNTIEVNAYFLDIDLKTNINGFMLAEEIRRLEPRAFIIFITTHGEMQYLTFKYKTEALDFIIKEDFFNLKNNIKQCLESIKKKVETYNNIIYKNTKGANSKIFEIETRDKIIREPFNTIVYFKVSDVVHRVIMSSLNRHIEFYASLKDIEKSLDERFFRCENSTIINTDMIKNIDKKKRIVYMINDEECLISIRKLSKFNKIKK